MLLEENKGQKLYDFAGKIFPYCRSITGEGVRQTLRDLKEYIEEDNGPVLEIKEIKTGTEAFDWVIPKEWQINEAYIEDEVGNKIVDMKNNNLHVMGYSTPIDKWVDLAELKKHVFVQEEQPYVIPYVTSYYEERYGFCMSKNRLELLPEGKYHMYIDSKLFDGVLNYAEVIIPGETEEEIFFSTYICHPSMANNECSGPALCAELVRFVASMKKRRYTYRFIFVPETIGSIAYLSINNHLAKMQDTMVAGFNISCVGDDNTYSMVETKYADTLSDKVLKNVLRFQTDDTYKNYTFLDRGSDERQYNAAGVDLPVTCFCRSKFSAYPEYHTSADNMKFVSPEGFQGSYDVMTQVIRALEYNGYYKMTVLCEPQLGPRGLFPNVSQKGNYDGVMGMMLFIAYADGKNDLFDISDRINIPVKMIINYIEDLMDNDLIEKE